MKIDSAQIIVGEGWVRWGAGLVEKTIKAAMLIFWHRHPMMLPDKPQYKQIKNSVFFQ